MLSALASLLKALFARRTPREEPRPASVDSPFDEIHALPIEDHIDLHPFAPRDIPSVVEEYLEQCLLHGFEEVRIIHGRGKGIQRRIVRSLLAKHPRVVSFRDAPPELGGWGATVATLGRKPADQEARRSSNPNRAR